LLDTILTSNEDELNAKYSRQFGIADVTVLSSLGSYLGLHCDAILVFINSELNHTSIEITREELTVRHLAQYLSFRGREKRKEIVLTTCAPYTTKQCSLIRVYLIFRNTRTWDKIIMQL